MFTPAQIEAAAPFQCIKKPRCAVLCVGCIDGAQAALAAAEAAAPPLPDEIAGLIDWAHKATTISPNHKDYPGTIGLVEKLEAALRALAQENEKMRTPQTPPDFENILDGASKIKDRRIHELEAERDAIRAKTFDECIEAVAWHHGTAWIVDKLRALAQADKKIDTSDIPEAQRGILRKGEAHHAISGGLGKR